MTYYFVFSPVGRSGFNLGALDRERGSDLVVAEFVGEQRGKWVKVRQKVLGAAEPKTVDAWANLDHVALVRE